MSKLEHIHINTGDIRLHLVSQGAGPLVVFCHGFPGHWSNWCQQLQDLSEAGYRAVALDMRGYGESSRPIEVADYHMDAQIADLCALLDALGEEQAVFVGQDFGAPLVWNLAIRQPHRVRAVVGISVPFDHDYYGRSCLGHLPTEELRQHPLGQLLVASPINPPSHGFKAIAEHQFLHAAYFQSIGPADAELGNNCREFLQRIYWGLSAKGSLGDWSNARAADTGYLDVLPKAPPLPWAWLSEAQMDAMEAAYLQVSAAEAFSGALASYRVADINWHQGADYAAESVSQPALFIAGAEDPVMAAVNEDTLNRMRARVPRLQGIEVIAGAGHFVQLEQAKATSERLLSFLNSLPS